LSVVEFCLLINRKGGGVIIADHFAKVDKNIYFHKNSLLNGHIEQAKLRCPA
jgi:hypothetical protein